MDLSKATWRKSSRSGPDGGECVEVAAWRKSSRSASNGGECVEVAGLSRLVAIRDSKNPQGPVLTFAPETWRAFAEGLKRA